MPKIYQFLTTFLGLNLDQNTLEFRHMIPRALIVYLVGILLIRIGKRRFLAKPTAFDLMLVLILGSVLSRAITGNAAFFPTLGTGFVLIFLHWVFSFSTFYSSKLGVILKGRAEILIKDGVIEWNQMRRHHISYRDLLSALRRNAKLSNPKDVKLAVIERNGQISIIPKPRKPEIVEMHVENGVQIVRIELHAAASKDAVMLED